MTDLPIPASAIEAAARAMWEDYQDKTTAEEQVSHEEEAETVLRAAFDELGMGWESDYGDEKEARLRHRLVSRWMPVNDVVEES